MKALGRPCCRLGRGRRTRPSPSPGGRRRPGRRRPTPPTPGRHRRRCGPRRPRRAPPTSGPPPQQQHVHRPIDGADDRPHVLDGEQPRRVEHVGAGLLVRLQAADRVVEVADAVQQVLGPRRQHQTRSPWPPRGRRDAVGRQADLVDRALVVTPEVLDRCPGRAGRGGRLDRRCHAGRVVGEAVLEVGVHRQRRGGGECRGVGQGFLRADPAVRTAERGGEPGARRGDGREAE